MAFNLPTDTLGIPRTKMWKAKCSVNCFHQETFNRLEAVDDVDIENKWLCDEVSLSNSVWL